jgi:hypothetical protein
VVYESIENLAVRAAGRHGGGDYPPPSDSPASVCTPKHLRHTIVDRVNVLAVSDAWIGLVGVLLGGLIGFVSSWLVHRSERSERTLERSRAERKEAYASLLTKAEDSMHKFQWVAEGEFGSQEAERERVQEANVFYDQEVTPRYRVLKIIGPPRVVEAARDMRKSLNAVRRLWIDTERLPRADDAEFKAAHNQYREERNRFIKLARADLEQGIQWHAEETEHA